MTKKTFRGEVWDNTDPAVLQELVRINTEAVDGKVGQDGYTAKATAYLQTFFDRKIEVLYTINGTAANIIALKALLGRYGSVICAEQAHINTYECGATEYNLGSKLLTSPTADGKLTPALIDGVLREHESHQYIPQVIAITQPTELGTLYRVARIIRTRLKAAYYGAFHTFFFDGRWPICRKEEQKSPQIRGFQVTDF